VARHDTSLLVVTSSVTRKLQDLADWGERTVMSGPAHTNGWGFFAQTRQHATGQASIRWVCLKFLQT
jgi:hypothetical protein